MYILFTLPQRIRAGCDQCANNLRQPDGALPQRIRAGCDQSRQSENTAHPELCHSAFARVATSFHFKIVYLCRLCLSAFARVATTSLKDGHEIHFLCLSAFARVATSSRLVCLLRSRLCLSAFARVATSSGQLSSYTPATLPQRIRAGCDEIQRQVHGHSGSLPQRIRAGCDSDEEIRAYAWIFFATAHSCGLRLRKSNAAHCEFAARR